MEWPFLTSKLSLSRELGGCGKGTGLACGMSAEKGWEFIPSSCIPDISFRCTFDISKVWPRLWYNTFLILFPTFHEFSAKKLEEIICHFNAKTVLHCFLLSLILFLTFYEVLQKIGRNLLRHFNAQTVIQCFLLTLILFLTFHEDSPKHRKKSYMHSNGKTVMQHFLFT